MLRHEEPQFEPEQNAAQTRVTAEELARAISTLEARRLDEAEKLKGTIPLGQAVSELGLDATPEELLAEVRAQRQASTPLPRTAASEAVIPPIPPLPQTLAAALREAAAAAAPGLKDAARAASPALKQGWDAVSQHAAAHNRHKKRRGGKRWVWASLGVFFAILGASSGGFSSGHWKSLSHVPDNHVVHTSTASVSQIVHQRAPDQVRVRDHGGVDNGWQIVKHDGRTYIRGWVLPQSVSSLESKPVRLYNDDDAGLLEGVDVEKVTLPLDSLTLDGTNSTDDWTELDLSHIKPDAHLQEDE